MGREFIGFRMSGKGDRGYTGHERRLIAVRLRTEILPREMDPVDLLRWMQDNGIPLSAVLRVEEEYEEPVVAVSWSTDMTEEEWDEHCRQVERKIGKGRT